MTFGYNYLHPVFNGDSTPNDTHVFDPRGGHILLCKIRCWSGVYLGICGGVFGQFSQFNDQCLRS